MAPRAPAKKRTLLGYLERGIAMLHLDARRPGVAVPRQYAHDPHLRLNLSYRYQIPDLEVGDEQVHATLSFGGRPFHCIVPWEAIFGITSETGDGQVWPEDLPVEVVEAAAETESRRGPSLAAVEAQEEPPDQSPSTARGRPNLRLVR
ncbi:MAG: ClpXP protease specificity-enhancing factor SspB [Myxococcales bacterium]|nr:ClpXP protease specificity-enhancing factor SspB [Myxococcales bacterium]